MEIDLLQQFSINKEYVVEEFDQEILLYAATKSSGVYLNQTAYLVWQLCGQGKTVRDMISLLEMSYPSEKKTIHADVCAAVTSLVEYGAILGSSS